MTLEKRIVNCDREVMEELEECLHTLCDDQNVKGIFIFVSSLDGEGDSAYSFGHLELSDFVDIMKAVVKAETVEDANQ